MPHCALPHPRADSGAVARHAHTTHSHTSHAEVHSWVTCCGEQLLGGPSATFDSITNNVLVDLQGVVEQSDVGDGSWNVVQMLTTAFGLCRPMPVFRPELLSYAAKMYGAWTATIRILQHQLLTLDDDLRPARLSVRHSGETLWVSMCTNRWLVSVSL
jgi:hypothetical protein